MDFEWWLIIWSFSYWNTFYLIVSKNDHSLYSLYILDTVISWKTREVIWLIILVLRLFSLILICLWIHEVSWINVMGNNTTSIQIDPNEVEYDHLLNKPIVICLQLISNSTYFLLKIVLSSHKYAYCHD